jgi:hypothetical protein
MVSRSSAFVISKGIAMAFATDSELALAGRKGAHVSWSNTVDRTARTAPARAALEQKFLDECDGDPVRAASRRKAYFADLALKSAQARRRKATAGDAA